MSDEQYWLYAPVDPEANELLHTALEPTVATVLAHSFLTELDEKHGVRDIVFLVDGSRSLQVACQRHGVDFRYENHGNRNAVERVSQEIKRLTFCFSNCFSNADAEAVEDWIKSFSFAWNQLI